MATAPDRAALDASGIFPHNQAAHSAAVAEARAAGKRNTDSTSSTYTRPFLKLLGWRRRTSHPDGAKQSFSKKSPWLLLALVAAAVLPVALAASLSIHALVTDQQQLIENDYRANARAVMNAVDSELLNVRRSAAALASQPEFIHGDPEAMYRRAKLWLADHQTWAGIILIDATATRQVFNTSVPFGATEHGPADAESVKSVIHDRTSMIGPGARGHYGRFLVPVRVPIFRNGDIAYVMSVLLMPERIADIVRSQTIEGRIAAILDQSYTVVARGNSQEYVGQTGTADVLGNLNQLVVSPGRGGYEYARVMLRSRETGWYAAVGAPLASVRGSLDKRIADIALISVAAALLSIGFTLYIGHSIQKIARTEEAAGRRQLQNLVEVADQHRAEAQALHAQVKTVIEHLPVGAALIDSDGRVIVDNPAFHRYLPESRLASVDSEAHRHWIAHDDQGRRIPPEQYPGSRALRGELIRDQEFVYRTPDGEEHWTMVSGIPIRSSNGRQAGALLVIVDTDNLKSAEAGLRESEARFRLMADHAPALIWLADASGNVTFANRWYEKMFGNTADIQEEGWRRILYPADVESFYEAFRQATAERTTFDCDARVIDAEGRLRWLRCKGVPRFDSYGHYLGYIGCNVEITEAKEAEEALRQSEERYRLIIESARDFAIFTTDLTGHVTTWNSGAESILGYDAKTIIGRHFDIILPPEDRDTAPGTELRAAYEKERAETERWHLHHDGSRFWASGLTMALKDTEGRVKGHLHILRDRTDKRREDEQRNLLLEELNHRVKNTLATVQSLAIQTMRNTSSPAEFRPTFEARLMALSRAHDLLTQGAWQGASLKAVVHQTLAPYADTSSHRVQIDGPDLRLAPNAAVMMNMTFHELATNAAKYGALSRETGEVAVLWRTINTANDGTQMVEITWEERGGPLVIAPSRHGFGSRLIKRGAVQELDGEVTLDFAPTGVRCHIRVPLSHKIETL